MGLYEFETKKDNLNKDHVYYLFHLGDTFSSDNINDINTAYITDEAMELVEDIFMNINKDYDRWGITIYKNNDIKLLINLFTQRLNDLNKNSVNIIPNDFFSEDWGKIIENIYLENINEIKILIENIINRLKKIKDENMIVVGV